MYMTWSTFNNIRMLLMACMPIVIFYLIWLINTSEAIRSEEGTLLDLVCWPDGNAIPVIITCGSIIAVVIEVTDTKEIQFNLSPPPFLKSVENLRCSTNCAVIGKLGYSSLAFARGFANVKFLYGLYQLFKAGLPKREYNVTNGLFYYLWALITMIIIFLAIIFYSGLQSTIIRAKIKGGITKAMLRYAIHLPSKIAIDRLQTRFHCCGRVGYQEWFYIPWYNAGQSTDILSLRKFVADNVPYSCCSMETMWPCIHHGVTQNGTIYKYDPTTQLTIWEAGCEEKLISEMMSVSWRFNAVMALIIIAMILQVSAVRYLHTAYKNGLNAENHLPCNAYLLRSRTDTKPQPGSKKKVFRKRKLRQARTLQWVTAAYRPRKRYTTSSQSDFNSSDELLKPIYE